MPIKLKEASLMCVNLFLNFSTLKNKYPVFPRRGAIPALKILLRANSAKNNEVYDENRWCF